MVRLYQLDDADTPFGHAITYATNDQTPIELQDLRANDELQQRLVLDLEELGYTYKTKRDNQPADEKTITSTRAAIAVLTVLRRLPHLARFAESRLFGTYYRRIFTNNLNGAQVVLATRIFADVERALAVLAKTSDRLVFLPYAAHHVAMLCGDLLLRPDSASPHAAHARRPFVDHRNLPFYLQEWSKNTAEIMEKATALIERALERLGIDESTNLQRVAAQFRRADLLDELLQMTDQLTLQDTND